VRNSSLVEESCAENVTGLKPAAEVVDIQVQERRCNAGGWNHQMNPDANREDSGGETQRGSTGPLDHRLGMVGERSSGDEGEL
jgi:hypothetical protein